MGALCRLWRLTVGKKIVMALTGAALCLFVLGHMLGNLKLFLGPEHFNGYAEWLRHAFEPLVPSYVVLWLARLGLIACVALHVIAAVQLYQLAQQARPLPYEKPDATLVFSRTSMMMRWGGLTVAGFILFHLAHLTWGWVYPSQYVAGDAYHNVVAGFQHWWLSGLYIAAMVPLCLHLYHGVWSMFQTLGLSSERYDHLRRPLALGFSLLVFVGNCTIPLSVLFGIVSLPGQ